MVKLAHVGRAIAKCKSTRDDRAGRRSPMKSNQSQSRVRRPSISSISDSSRSRNPIAIAPPTPPPSSESIRLGPGPKRCRSRGDRPAISGGAIEKTVITSLKRRCILGRTESKNPERASHLDWASDGRLLDIRDLPMPPPSRPGSLEISLAGGSVTGAGQ